jgi:hypothetical protein
MGCAARGFEIPHCVQDFAWALTPARRPSLLKRFPASTLGIFRSEFILEDIARRVGDHEAGRVNG